MENRKLIGDWRFRIQRMQTAHYQAAMKLDKQRVWFGSVSVVFSSIVGSAIFVEISEATRMDTKLGIALGLMSITAASLSGLQTFFNFGERAENHRKAGAKHAELRMELDLLFEQPADESIEKEILEDFRIRWAEMNSLYPTVPVGVWRSVYERYATEEPEMTKRNPA